MTCDAVNVTDASKDPSLPVYSYNDAVTYSCKTGYEHTAGDLTRTCTAINKWAGAVPVCTSRSMLSQKYLYLAFFLNKIIKQKLGMLSFQNCTCMNHRTLTLYV